MMDTAETTGRQQILRIRRFLMACASYLLWGVICIVAHYVGLMRVPIGALIGLGLLALLVNLAFYGLFASGLNRRLKYPSLTAAQMINGILWVSIMGYCSHTSLRGSYDVPCTEPGESLYRPDGHALCYLPGGPG